MAWKNSLRDGVRGAPPEMMQLAFAWRDGRMDRLGWRGVAPDLEESGQRGFAAWLLGLRQLKLGKKSEATDLFREAVVHAGKDEELRQMAARQLRELVLPSTP